MNHLSESDLRHAVDEPLSLTSRQQEHLHTCARCTAAYDDIRENARFAAGVLAGPAPSTDAYRAYRAVQSRLGAENCTAPSWGARLSARLQAQRRSLAVPLGGTALAAILAGSLALTPAGSLAQSFINVFQPKNVATVSVSSADLRGMLQLRHYGTVHPPASVANHRVADAAAAQTASGMNVLAPTSFPSGISHTASYTVVPGTTGSFTFSTSRANAWAAKQGKSLPAMPAGLDGSTLTVTTGNAVIATYGRSGGGIPGLIVGQMQAPRVSTTGVSVSTMENYVLGLPGVPSQFAAEVRALGDPTKTLVLPVPVDLGSSQPVTVHGTHGYAIGDGTGLGSVVIWEEGSVIYGVGGMIPQDQALQIANSLQ